MFFDFCMRNDHQVVACVWMEAMKVMPGLWIAQVEVAKVAQQILLSPKCGTNYMLFCGLACVHVEPVKIVS